MKRIFAILICVTLLAGCGEKPLEAMTLFAYFTPKEA